MKPTTYISETYPQIAIGSTKEREVKFRLGRFVATEKWQVDLIESNEWFNCFIFKAEPHTVEPIPTGGPAPIPGPAREGLAPDAEAHVVEAAEAEAEEPAEAQEPVEGAFDARPEYVVSETAKEVLEKAGINVPDAAKRLELADGDRLTVKMAEGLING